MDEQPGEPIATQSRRQFLRSGALFSAAALLAACGQQAAPAAPSKPAETKPVESKPAAPAKPAEAAKPAESKAAAPAQAGKVARLDMILFDGGWTPSLKMMLDKYKAEQGVEVVWDNPPQDRVVGGDDVGLALLGQHQAELLLVEPGQRRGIPDDLDTLLGLILLEHDLERRRPAAVE